MKAEEEKYPDSRVGSSLSVQIAAGWKRLCGWMQMPTNARNFCVPQTGVAPSTCQKCQQVPAPQVRHWAPEKIPAWGPESRGPLPRAGQKGPGYRGWLNLQTLPGTALMIATSPEPPLQPEQDPNPQVGTGSEGATLGGESPASGH